MTKKKSQNEAVAQLIDDALESISLQNANTSLDEPPPFNPEASSTNRLAAIDAQLAKIREECDGGKLSIGAFRRAGATAILLLTERYAITHKLWLIPAHAIAIAAFDLDDVNMSKSLLSQQEEAMDEHMNLWASYELPEIQRSAITAALILQRFCGLSAANAAKDIASVLNRANYRAPQGAAIEKWVRNALISESDRDSLKSEIRSYALALGISKDDAPQINAADIKQILAHHLDEKRMFKAPRGG